MSLAPRHADTLFGVILTCIMSGMVSGISTARSMGLDALMAAPTHWLHAWGRAFILAWPVAFVVFRLGAPRVRRFVGWLSRTG